MKDKCRFVLVKMAHKVPVAGRIGSRNHSNPIRQCSHFQLFLSVQQAFPLQTFDGRLALALLVAEGKFRINVVYYQ